MIKLVPSFKLGTKHLYLKDCKKPPSDAHRVKNPRKVPGLLINKWIAEKHSKDHFHNSRDMDSIY